MINSNIQKHTEFGKLVEDAFDRFEKDPKKLPPLPFNGSPVESPAEIRTREYCNYPWSWGRHPKMSATFCVRNTLIAVMSRQIGSQQNFRKAHLNHKCGSSMRRYSMLRDNLNNVNPFNRLNAPRIVKYAFGLVTVSRKLGYKTPILVYLYPEPLSWPKNSRKSSAPAEHRQEIQKFAQLVDGDEAKFQPLAFKELLQSWEMAGDSEVQQLANAIMGAHPPLA